jgi:hypothetical protein
MMFTAGYTVIAAEDDMLKISTALDAIHASISTSTYSLAGEIKCEYLGLVAKKPPLRGYLQSRPGTWNIKLKSNDGEISTYLSLASPKSGFQCNLKGYGLIYFKITDDEGKPAEEKIIKLRQKSIKYSDFVKEMISNFEGFDKIWPMPVK